uniref:Uncharacterized protein n=1 Tax=Anguilla anguilla TaxID=7936 RepID=A0A0E9TB82_ANGAN
MCTPQNCPLAHSCTVLGSHRATTR